DWVSFFERTSLVEQVLRRDPAGVYSRMDLAGRDRYRHVVEAIAKGSRVAEINVAEINVTEIDVAEMAVRLASEAQTEPMRKRHVGYWLIDAGLSRLESAFPFHPSLGYRAKRWVLQWPNLIY